MNEIIMKIENLTKEFDLDFFSKKRFKAVNNVSFEINKGEIISLIGESGSGKTTVGKMILRLLKPTSGKILFENKDIWDLKKNEVKEYYRNVQAIFQDPFSSFNTLFKINRVFNMIFDNFFPEEKNRKEKIEKVISQVGMNPTNILGKYPHQLSGGQLQRLLIARALLMNVKVLVADELISMLDASTRIDVLNLLAEISEKTGMSIIFITHDLSLGYYLSDTTLIMYKGEIVEKGDTVEVYNNPQHPYTKMLLNSVPEIDRKWDKNEKFIPETIIKEIELYYQANKEKSTIYEAISKNHYVKVKK
ncbi:peptide ABC transporter ATPase [Marinitoga sp. 1135]|uniref:Oligopeptide/dipeptide ABC transporter, ATP-binding protein n=1 Tax=Marinitoga piezophila (strain DSM 14283 / JCM 11233 / KA3) TaxID=443254 RepID=H2J7W5_MARPK|nr:MULTISPECIES: ABC transporter ATP-binding protein [Marinitoga]AEX85456.1 oligopeptide/dipeptide ABC transporter, ATP-binding protein [Marinitoga piezophila KA3]APT75931.1 peptide ABC transporter ATPase [Marinitoga sp. 1137]NUU95674.1 peptide ABC transporter ATPase [Marinitoga sp. 1135]NUU97606.1 peptide ABC transporter ATPase [Marinitoga sp. 1138]